MRAIKNYRKNCTPYQNGVTFAEIKNVIYCEWDNNYTRIHTVDGSQYMVAKRSGDIQEVLEERSFMHSPPVSYQPQSHQQIRSWKRQLLYHVQQPNHSGYP